jgi:hypothetical protein
MWDVKLLEVKFNAEFGGEWWDSLRRIVPVHHLHQEDASGSA